MENSYGIGVANRYALFLDDESDPLETLTLKEQEKELKKKTKGAEKENKGKPEAPVKAKTTTQTAAATKKPPKEQKAAENKREDAKPRANSDDPAKPRNLKFNNNNENREDRNNRRNREDKFIPLENKGERVERPRREGGDSFESRNKGEGGRREGGGGGGGGGPNRDGRAIGNKPGGPRGPRRTFDDRRGKREYDRQSGSDKTHGYRGVKPIDKRDGAGSHNWGSNKEIIEDADRPNDNEQNWPEGGGEKPEGTAPEQPKEGGESTDAEPTAVEEEPKELTLDEWKAQRAGRSKPTYNIRKAGEGEDPSQWKKMYELKKRENEQDDDEDDEEYDASEYPQRVGRQKHILDIDIQFNDSRRPGGGGRGGRGQRAGGGGPRGNRGANPRGPRPDDRDRAERRFRNEEPPQGEDRTENRRAPKVDDERDFPSLG